MIKETYQNSCKHAGDLVSYLYDEISDAEKALFETHLAGCSLCADEFADFSIVRSSIIEWRDTEFQQLSTPAIVLPAQKNNFLAEKSNSRSPLAQVRALFSLSPAWMSAAAMAALMIFVGFVLVAVKFQRESSIDRVEKENKTLITSSPKEQVAELNTADSDSNKETVSKTSSKPLILESPKSQTETKNVPVKISQPTVVKNKKAVAEKNVKSVKSELKKYNQSPPPTLLADEDDTEDETLRLSDLFKEVGGK